MLMPTRAIGYHGSRAKDMSLEQTHETSRTDFLMAVENDRKAEFSASQNVVCSHVLFSPSFKHPFLFKGNLI